MIGGYHANFLSARWCARSGALSRRPFPHGPMLMGGSPSPWACKSRRHCLSPACVRRVGISVASGAIAAGATEGPARRAIVLRGAPSRNRAQRRSAIEGAGHSPGAPLAERKKVARVLPAPPPHAHARRPDKALVKSSKSCPDAPYRTDALLPDGNLTSRLSDTGASPSAWGGISAARRGPVSPCCLLAPFLIALPRASSLAGPSQ